jgi:hypothetical protein
MTNVRTLAERDLRHTLEGEFAVPVVLISPQGERAEKTVDGRPLTGRVLWNHKEINPETGEPVMVNSPVVTLRESSLPRIPKSGEVWGVIIPEGVRVWTQRKHYVTDADGIVESGRNLGYINLFLIEVADGSV